MADRRLRGERFLRHHKSLAGSAWRRLKPICVRRSQYLNNLIEQDHRWIKRQGRPMLGFKSTAATSTILSGILRKRQARYAFNPNPSWAEQFESSPPD